MKLSISRSLVLASALVASPLVASLEAQQPTTRPNLHANASRFGYAVIDISHIFKQYAKFTTALDSMKAQVQGVEAKLKADQAEVAKIAEQLKAFKPGTPDFKRLDNQFSTAKANFALKAERERKDILEKEAQIYYQAYLEVNDAVRVYAQRNNIGLVLRFNGQPIDPNNRQDVLRAINKPVVYDGGVDITLEVLDSLNRRGVAIRPEDRSPTFPR